MASGALSNESRPGSPGQAAPGPPQLPTDFRRGLETAQRFESSAFVLRGVFPALPRGDADARALLLAALEVLVHRYTQQEAFQLEIEVKETEVPSGSGALSFGIEEGDTARQLGERAARELSALPRGDGGARNGKAAALPIALSFVVDVSRPMKPPEGRELHLVVAREPDGFAGRVLYHAGLFRPDTVERLIGHLQVLCDGFSGRPDAPVSQLEMLTPEETRQVLVGWASPSVETAPRPVHRTFEAVAARQPGAIAATFEAESLSYRELDERSNRLAHHLVALGVGPGTRVAVCVHPSLDILVALLAIFKAGGVYVPLDPTHPETYQLRILEEAQPRVVLTHSKLQGTAAAQRFPRFCLDTDWALTDGAPAGPPGAGASLDDPAYLLYTSGTTGRPKGVLATQANLAFYLQAAARMYGFRAQDVFCSLARYTFSISMFELLSPLCCGGRLRLLTRDNVLAPDRFARLLQEVTVVHAGPSLLGSLFQYLRSNPSAPRSFPNLRHASSGGDLVPPHLLEEMKTVFENAELFVIYGCTEISCMGTTYPVIRGQEVTSSFVGKPFPNMAVRLVDPQGNPVPIGVLGEICFAGEGVVPGYLERPELTAEKFVNIDGGRFYKTGDLGRWHADGNIEIRGRRDFQVQLRGIRIELVGIENAIRELKLAAQCAVSLSRVSEHDVRLVAFLVQPRHLGIGEFRRELSAHLPEYMLPQHLVVLESLPLTANGKLDRKALQEIPWEPLREAKTGRATPRNAIERKVADVFGRALGTAEIGLDDDFFDLGGHSLLAITLMQDLENELGFSFPLDSLFIHSTVRALAAHVQDPSLHVPRPILLSASADNPPLFVIAGVHLYRLLAKHLEGDFSVFGVYSTQELLLFEASDRDFPVDELARDYIDIIRRQQPRGPYRIAGMSFGGVVVYEIAQQLVAAGEQVAFLGLLDTDLPERGGGSLWTRVRRLAAQPPREMARVVWARVRERIQRALQPQPVARFAKYASDDKLGPLETMRETVYDVAAASYREVARPYYGAVTLIVAARRQQQELGSPDCGWGPFVPSLAIHFVDADHLGLIEEPQVRSVAAVFRVAAKGESQTPAGLPASGAPLKNNDRPTERVG